MAYADELRLTPFSTSRDAKPKWTAPLCASLVVDVRFSVDSMAVAFWRDEERWLALHTLTGEIIVERPLFFDPIGCFNGVGWVGVLLRPSTATAVVSSTGAVTASAPLAFVPYSACILSSGELGLDNGDIVEPATGDVIWNFRAIAEDHVPRALA